MKKEKGEDEESREGWHLLDVIACLAQRAVHRPRLVGVRARPTPLAHRGPGGVPVVTLGAGEASGLAGGVLVGAHITGRAVGLARLVLEVAQAAGCTLLRPVLVRGVTW